MYTYSQGTIAVEATSISVSEDGQTATVLTGEGVSYEIDVSDVYYTHTGTVSLRDNRADDVVMTATSSATEFRVGNVEACLLYTSPSPRDRQKSRMPSSA